MAGEPHRQRKRRGGPHPSLKGKNRDQPLRTPVPEGGLGQRIQDGRRNLLNVDSTIAFTCFGGVEITFNGDGTEDGTGENELDRLHLTGLIGDDDEDDEKVRLTGDYSEISLIANAQVTVLEEVVSNLYTDLGISLENVTL